MCGKSCLITSYGRNVFPDPALPTVYEDYSVKVDVRDTPITLEIIDTSGLDDYDRLRPLSYPETDVFLICFSAGYKNSFKQIAYKWVPEIRRHNPETPFVLVGTQIDLREDEEWLQRQHYFVSQDDAKNAARLHGAAGYVECSALKKINVKEVFDQAIVAATQQADERSNLCTIL